MVRASRSVQANRGHWIYPLQGTGCRFTTATGSFGDDRWKLRAAALAGTVRGGSGRFERGFLTVAPGDSLWLHDAVGIVGRAEVVAHSGRPDPTVTFRIERGPTRVLSHDPVPEALLRRWLGSSRSTPIELSHNRIVCEGLAWWLDDLDARDRTQLDRIGMSTLRAVATRQPGRLDDRTLDASIRLLWSRDLAIGLPTGKARPADIVARGGDRLVVLSIVRASGNRGRSAVLGALGRLAWYGSTVRAKAPRLGLQSEVWFVFVKPPAKDLVQFLEGEGCSVAWRDGVELRLSPKTLHRWPRLENPKQAEEAPKPRLVLAPPPRTSDDAPDDCTPLMADRLAALEDHDRARGVMPVQVVRPKHTAQLLVDGGATAEGRASASR